MARLQAAEDEKKAFQEASNKYKMELDEKYEAQLKLESQVNWLFSTQMIRIKHGFSLTVFRLKKLKIKNQKSNEWELKPRMKLDS